MNLQEVLKIKFNIESDRFSRPTDNPCIIDNCCRRKQSKNLCAMHYRRFRVYGDPLFTKKNDKIL